jgi:acetate CoA/acetoacetate CoA-transferase beta subunit
MVPGMGGAMDLVTGARRVIVAMQHTAKGAQDRQAMHAAADLELRRIDLLVTELAVISFENGVATLRETAPGRLGTAGAGRHRGRRWSCPTGSRR